MNFYKKNISKKLSLLCFVVLVACGKNSSLNNLKEIYINNENIRDTVNVSGFIDSIEIIKLIEPKHNSIGYSYQVYVNNNFYIVFDMFNTRKINVFSRDGNFVKTLQKQGADKTDAISIIDCFVNDKKEIEIYDFAQMSLNIYDSSLNFKKTVKGKKLLHYVHISKIPNSHNYIAYSNYDMNNITISKKNTNLDMLDSNLNIIKSYMPYKESLQGVSMISGDHQFYIYNDSLRFMRIYDPFVYYITDDNISKQYKIVYAKGNLPTNTSDLIETKNKKINNINKNSYEISSELEKYSHPADLLLEADKYMYLISIDSSDNTNKFFVSLIDKNVLRDIFSAKVLEDTINFKIVLPMLRYYSSETKWMMAECTGNELNKLLLKNSPFRKTVNIKDDASYFVNIKFN